MSLPGRNLSIPELKAYLERAPRVRLAHLPTPLEELSHFSRDLGGPPVWIKRDDCTGLALGGNKARHNEFIFGHAVAEGADVIVWGAGTQSNNCRQTAAACAKLGLECRLILSRTHFADDVQGNLLLMHILGAKIEFADVPVGSALDERIAAAARELAAAGRKPYFWNRDVVKPRATLSYVLGMVELAEQFHAAGVWPQAIYVCSAGSTGAGLALGRAALGLDVPIRSIAPLRWPWDMAADMAHDANIAAGVIGLPTRLDASDIDVTDAYIGDDYGVSTTAGMDATARLARTEGILLDPIYTAKALGALISDIESGRLNSRDPVVFVHTGGTPALFAYRDDLVRMIR